ncbi:MAG: hypothetical protein WCW16_00050 [Candidatus Magasanikbacteria bacterium]
MVVILLYLFLVVLYILVFIFIWYTLYAMIKGAPFLPTSSQHVREMIDMANPQKGEYLIDLGSGDGRILFQAARTGCSSLGVEMNPLLYWWSSIRRKISNVHNVEIRRQDLWKTDVSRADIVSLFFIAPKMDRLRMKLQKEMKSGSRVVSYGFKFPNWQPELKHGSIYLYKIH